MLWQTFWYIISLSILTNTWENSGFCIFQGQVTCQVETLILCKNVACVTSNYLYLAHNTSKWSTLYALYLCVTYEALYKIFMLQHKMKVGEGRNFSKIFTNFQILRYVVITIITIWRQKSMENVVTNILVYYMNSYTNYSWRY